MEFWYNPPVDVSRIEVSLECIDLHLKVSNTVLWDALGEYNAYDYPVLNVYLPIRIISRYSISEKLGKQPERQKRLCGCSFEFARCRENGSTQLPWSIPPVARAMRELGNDVKVSMR